MTRHPLLTAFLATLAGVLGAEALGIAATFAASCATVAAVALIWALRRRRGVVVTSWTLAAMVACLARAGTGPPRPPDTCGLIQGRRGYAESTWRGRVAAPITIQPAGMRTVLALESELCGGGWLPRRGRVGVTLREGPAVQRGDLVELKLAVEPVSAARNPGEPDGAIQAIIDDVDAAARAISVHRVLTHAQGLMAGVDMARRASALALNMRLTPAAAGVARGLVMGDRGGLTAADREAWADAGLAHLLAVSGMHVTMVVLVISWLVRALAGFARGLVERCSLVVLAALVALPSAVLFCLWSASPASALRATLMGSVGLFGSIIGRPARALEALCFTGLVMVLEQPLVVHDAGFLLSMAAVAALLAAPRLEKDEAADFARPLWRLVIRARRAFLLGLLASVAATLAALPITVVFFGRVSLVAPLTNLVAVPLGAILATPLTLAVVALAPLAPTLADVLAVPLDVLLGWLLAVVHVGERLPGAAVAFRAPNVVELVLYVAALGTAFAALRSEKRRRHYALLFVAVVAALGLALAGRAMPSGREGELVVTVPYVGQGDAMLLRFPSGEVALVDAGGALPGSDWDPGRQVIAPLLRRRGFAALDLAVVSHAHPDHLGGFAYLAERFPIGTLWYTGQLDEPGAMERLATQVLARGGQVRSAHELPLEVDYGGVHIAILHPRAEETGYFPELGFNDNSLVLRLTHGRRSILLTGDIEALAEREIVESGALLQADVLKVGHHGSRTSSSDVFLDAVRPRIALVSCGAHNQFGFPHAEVVDRFVSRGVPFLTTAERGAIELRSDGVTWRVTTWRPGLRLPVIDGIAHIPNGD